MSLKTKNKLKIRNLMISNTEELKELIIKSLEDKKAENISIIDLGENIILAKYIIIASGRSVKNVSAIADFVAHEVKKNSNINVGIEGVNSSEWALVDCGDVIVHVFYPEARSHFKIEELWAKRKKEL